MLGFYTPPLTIGLLIRRKHTILHQHIGITESYGTLIWTGAVIVGTRYAAVRMCVIVHEVTLIKTVQPAFFEEQGSRVIV